MELYDWSEVETDRPIPFLHRQRIEGDNILVAMVKLDKGCIVAVHQHDSEQIAYIVSGKVKWTLGEDRKEIVATGGQVLRLPGNFPHGVEALEDSVILDMLSPVGAMGVDNQPSD